MEDSNSKKKITQTDVQSFKEIVSGETELNSSASLKEDWSCCKTRPQSSWSSE